MSRSSLVEKSIFAAAFVGCIVLVNVLAIGTFWRIDLTRGNQYTLSEASRETVANLDDRLTVKAYFSDDLPPPYSTNARYVKDLLDEYYAASNGNLSYEFLDPVSQETEEDKEKRKEIRRDIFGRAMRDMTDVERELQSLGIQPVEVRVNEGDSLEVKRVYMGISLRYGDDREAIPVVTNTDTLEYDLTSLMRKLVRSDVPKIGLITGRDGLDPRQDLSTVMGLLSQQYEVTPIDLTTNAQIPEDVDGILVTGPSEPFEDDEIAAIDRFVRSGHAAAFLLDRIRVDLQTTDYDEVSHGLGDLLAGYGVAIRDGVLVDAQCAQINITEQRGFMRVQRPVQYPFMPFVEQLDQEHPVTRGLRDVAFPFVSALEVTADDENAEILVRSSDQSWIETMPLNLNPLQRWPATVEFTGPHPLVAAVRVSVEDDDAAPGRVLVIGGSSLLENQFLMGAGRALVLNLVDWLLLDQAMLEIRTRGVAAPPLDELSDATRRTLKYGNIIGVPLAFILIGLIRWRMRERRRRLVVA